MIEILTLIFLGGFVSVTIHFYWARVIIVGAIFVAWIVLPLLGLALGFSDACQNSIGQCLWVGILSLPLLWLLSVFWRIAASSFYEWIKKHPPSQYGLLDRI